MTALAPVAAPSPKPLYFKIISNVRGIPHPSSVTKWINDVVMTAPEIRNVHAFCRFLRLLASLGSEPTRHKEVTRDIGIAPANVERYLQYLETSAIVIRIPANLKSNEAGSAPSVIVFADREFQSDCREHLCRGIPVSDCVATHRWNLLADLARKCKAIASECALSYSDISLENVTFPVLHVHRPGRSNPRTFVLCFDSDEHLFSAGVWAGLAEKERDIDILAVYYRNQEVDLNVSELELARILSDTSTRVD